MFLFHLVLLGKLLSSYLAFSCGQTSESAWTLGDFELLSIDPCAVVNGREKNVFADLECSRAHFVPFTDTRGEAVMSLLCFGWGRFVFLRDILSCCPLCLWFQRPQVRILILPLHGFCMWVSEQGCIVWTVPVAPAGTFETHV